MKSITNQRAQSHTQSFNQVIPESNDRIAQIPDGCAEYVTATSYEEYKIHTQFTNIFMKNVKVCKTNLSDIDFARLTIDYYVQRLTYERLVYHT